MPVPLILAHRGASASARENTLEAFRLAVAQDADGIELDVHRTSDGVLVVHHDSDVEEVGAIGLAPFERIRSGAPWIPTLDEALAVTGDLLLDIEVKADPAKRGDGGPTARQVARWVTEQRLERRVVVTSFDWDLVAEVRSDASTVPTGLLLTSATPVADAVERASTVGHRWVVAPWSSLIVLDPVSIEEAHGRQLALVAWTVDDPDVMRQLAALGVDGIITNDPAGANAAFSG